MNGRTIIKKLEVERLPPEPANATSTDAEVSEGDRRTLAAILEYQLRKRARDPHDIVGTRLDADPN